MTETHIDPTREQFDAFKALPRDAPIAMHNLVRYRKRAAYRLAAVHRQAAVATSRLIRCEPRETGAAFA
jgi:hypothetical protein